MQLLHGLQPGRILRREEQCSFHLAHCILDALAVVDPRIVGEDHDVLVCSLGVTPQLVQRAVDEVLEDDAISTALYDLHGDHPVLGHGRHEREAVACGLLGRLPSVQQDHVLLKGQGLLLHLCTSRLTATIERTDAQHDCTALSIVIQQPPLRSRHVEASHLLLILPSPTAQTEGLHSSHHGGKA